jgi:hypothetical protein
MFAFDGSLSLIYYGEQFHVPSLVTYCIILYCTLEHNWQSRGITLPEIRPSVAITYSYIQSRESNAFTQYHRRS